MRLQAAQTGSAHLEHQFARSGDRIKYKPLLGHDSSTGTVPIVRLFLAALPVVLLGEAKVAQEFGVHPLERPPLSLAKLHGLLDAVPVVLV